ncbi:NAD kinase [Niastella koreensis]|jgi:NAD+ kinase|uniref:NAD kinase n=3 Tax=Niastella TaxID=354354 RepID=A0A1V9EX22_9BACT|nr:MULTISPECIES: NAD kinase [Niastella]AEW02815.1 inorganic polyphosphate/ATP-NAD kinase [Niastella koreensis GR20-10]OQP50678.1 NAD kinase [Niastella yeongjuensis]OQP55152.1 NAD kinase [Niastella koreensis]SEN23216.1 NAD+ kinase [Niastella yeongjuensis]
MKVAIYSRVIDDDQYSKVQQLLDELDKENIHPVIYKPFYEMIQSSVRFSEKTTLFNDSGDLTDAIDFLISLGGDGTLLDTVTLVRDKNIPVLGINFGRLGFLASIGSKELHIAVQSLVKRTILIDKRSLIHLDASKPLFGDVPYGLNEFAIHKTDTSPMIKIHTYLNGEFLNTYWADGVIVATPTGSTGYSLSCNGPVVFPESSSFVITPVAPHNLNVRPIIVPDDNIISFEIEGRTDHFICALDSRKELVDKKVQLAVRNESFTLSLVRLNENNFLQTLRNKLSWGLDTRN